MVTVQGKSVAYWVFLAVSVAFAMRIAVRAPHSMDARLVILLTIVPFLAAIFAGRQLTLGPSRQLWIMLAAAVASTCLLTYVLTPENAFEPWLMLIMATNAGRTMECNVCASELSLDVQK